MTLASGELSDEDVDSDTVEESERVLAFFDQLIQEENVMGDSSSEFGKKNYSTQVVLKWLSVNMYMYIYNS